MRAAYKTPHQLGIQQNHLFCRKLFFHPTHHLTLMDLVLEVLQKLSGNLEKDTASSEILVNEKLPNSVLPQVLALQGIHKIFQKAK